VDSNIKGFFNIIDSLKYNQPKKFLFASSSSIYGDSKIFPLKDSHNLEPINIYALSKKIIIMKKLPRFVLKKIKQNFWD